MRCSVWRTVAENVAESLRKGDTVVVTGELVQRTYETREGEKRTVVEMAVREIGLSLRYHAARSQRPARVEPTIPYAPSYKPDEPPPADEPPAEDSQDKPKAPRRQRATA
jgi:single-stranded DNA-binding protein